MEPALPVVVNILASLLSSFMVGLISVFMFVTVSLVISIGVILATTELDPVVMVI